MARLCGTTSRPVPFPPSPQLRHDLAEGVSVERLVVRPKVVHMTWVLVILTNARHAYERAARPRVRAGVVDRTRSRPLVGQTNEETTVGREQVYRGRGVVPVIAAESKTQFLTLGVTKGQVDGRPDARVHEPPARLKQPLRQT